MSEDVFIDMLEDDPFPAPQEKPARRLNYAEKLRAGLVERKPRQRINPIAKKKVTRRRLYLKWKESVLDGAKCAFPNCIEKHNLDLHHPHGRSGDNLFKGVACCRLHHDWIHGHPDAAFDAGWLTPTYRNYAPNPNHPQPFTLLPYP